MSIAFISWLIQKWGSYVPEIQEYEYKLKSAHRKLAVQTQEIEDLKVDVSLCEHIMEQAHEDVKNAEEEVKQLDYMLQLERAKHPLS